MCCFSRAVEHVGATHVYARPLEDGRQVLAYSMNVRFAEPVAMILPLPVPPDSPDDAVRFIDLEAYPKLFADMRQAFPPIYGVMQAKGGLLRSRSADTPKLVVHDVGAFEASFVPRIADFDRLDARFRLAPDVWKKLPAYADFGFAVFRLKPQKGMLGGLRTQTIHPMAFEFPRRDPRELFFPTVHVHDGVVHERATFDHTLFCQVEGVVAGTLGWTRSTGVLGKTMKPAASAVADLSRGGFCHPLFGEMPNRDVVLPTPRWSGGPTEFHGEFHTARVRAAYAYMPVDDVPAEGKAWRAITLDHLDRIAALLREGVPALAARERYAWGLAPMPPNIPPFWPYRYPQPALAQGMPTVISFHPFDARVEPQEVLFAFEKHPDGDTQAAIEGALKRLLGRLQA